MRYIQTNLTPLMLMVVANLICLCFRLPGKDMRYIQTNFNASYVDGGGQSNHPNTHQVLTVNQEDTTDYNLFDFII